PRPPLGGRPSREARRGPPEGLIGLRQARPRALAVLRPETARLGAVRGSGPAGTTSRQPAANRVVDGSCPQATSLGLASKGERTGLRGAHRRSDRLRRGVGPPAR